MLIQRHQQFALHGGHLHSWPPSSVAQRRQDQAVMPHAQLHETSQNLPYLLGRAATPKGLAARRRAGRQVHVSSPAPRTFMPRRTGVRLIPPDEIRTAGERERRPALWPSRMNEPPSTRQAAPPSRPATYDRYEYNKNEAHAPRLVSGVTIVTWPFIFWRLHIIAFASSSPVD